jgi:mediator of RNA polymerase II transcription subunit 17
MSDDEFRISIEPQVKDELLSFDDDSLPLGQIIKRITHERGSFTELTEESLLHEIEAAQMLDTKDEDGLFHEELSMDNQSSSNSDENSGEASSSVGTSAGSAPTNGSNNYKDLNVISNGGSSNGAANGAFNDEEDDADLSFDQVRHELLSLVSVAHNESALSQDFVSLLMSCLRPAAGTTSMSPHLKQFIPVGSLNADNSKPSDMDDDPLVAAGWKLQALDHSASLISRAAKRLQNEAEKEELYWENVLSIVSFGEVLFKIRKGDMRGLGIKYGYGDAGSQYYDKGVATLRRKADGTMSFQTGLNKRTKVVRVSLYSVVNGERVFEGSSKSPEILPERSVQNEIINARNLLFEEELFFEMAKEARGLVSHRVRIVNGKIVVKLFDEILEIEFVSPEPTADEDGKDATLEESTNETNENNITTNEDNKNNMAEDEEMTDAPPAVKISRRASLISTTFHILLCYAHRKNLETKASVPKPLNTKEKKSKSALYILRPLIAHILHHKIIARTHKTIELISQNIVNLQVSSELVEATTEEMQGSTSGYLGRLAVHPMSKIVIKQDPVSGTAKHASHVEVLTGSPLQSYLPLYEAFAYVKDDNKDREVSKGTFWDLGELEDWIRWVLAEEF